MGSARTIGIGLVHYPASWSLALGALSLLAVVAVLRGASRRLGIGMRSVAVGIAAAVGLVFAAAGLARIAAGLYERWYPDPRVHPLGEYLLPSSAPFAIVALLIVGALLALAYRAAVRRLGATEVALGGLVLWLVVSALCLAFTRVGAYLFQWPLLAAAATWIWLGRDPRRDRIILLIPAALALALMTAQGLLAFTGDGVAGLAGPAALVALVMGLFASALSGHRRNDATQASSASTVADGRARQTPRKGIAVAFSPLCGPRSAHDAPSAAEPVPAVPQPARA